MTERELKEHILQATRSGNAKWIRKCIQDGVDINSEDDEGLTILHRAARRGNSNAIDALIEGGADINAKTKNGETPLHCAVRWGDDSIVAVLVEWGVDCTVSDNLGTTPLHWAAALGYDRIVQILVEQGVDVNAKDNKASTPLHMAVESGKKRSAEILVQSGADIAIKNKEKRSPLSYASQQLKDSIQDLATAFLEIKAAFPKIAGTKEFRTLLTRGFYSFHNNRIYLAGACNVGKTTLASNLIGEKISLKWNSTDGLVIYFGRNGIDLEKRIMVPLKRGPQDSIILASVLRGQPSIDQTPSTTAERKSREDPTLSKPFQNMQIQYEARKSDAQQSDIAQSTSQIMSSSQPTPARKTKQISVKRKERSHGSMSEDKHELLATKKENTDVQHSIIDEIRKGEYKVLIAPSDLVDFGGQKAYDLTHQLFIQQKGAFVLLLDGRKDLDEVLSEYKNGKMTTRDIVLHWVNSILTYCSSENDDIYPVIIFAATHRDKLSKPKQDEQSKVFTKQLTEMFSEHEHRKRIIYQTIFFINGTDKDDLGVEKLKKYLVDMAFQQKSWGEKMPMAWVPLELQMVEMQTAEIFIIKYTQLEELNSYNNDLSLKKDQLKHFLRCQHSLGRVMFFDIPILDQYIIIQPTAMVDILRSFITDEIFWPRESVLRSILSTASTSGIIKKSDLFKLWSQNEFQKYVTTAEIKEYITKVLVHLDILVPTKRFDEAGENLPDTFIVPCMIRRGQLTENIHNDKAIFLSYKLVKSTIPNALAYKLIGAVLNIWPLKRKDGIACLFDKAAILVIDDANELYLTFKEDRCIVALFNKTSKNFISPDISSVIQECLTLTLTKVLEFYSTIIGKSASGTDVSQLFLVEVGQKCVKNLCFVSPSEIKDQSSWICKHKQKHSSKYPLYWVFDQKQEMCIYECPGMDAQALNEIPEDKHLIRLAKLIGRKFNQFIIYLGLSHADWENIQDEITHVNRLTKMFVGLCEWKKQKQAQNIRPNFQCLASALKEIEYSDHFLCQIFREKFTAVFAMDDSRLQETPNDNVLYELSRTIGPHTVHLGVELELEMTSIEETQFRYSKDMYAQTFDILNKWQRSGKGQRTARALMLALQHVDPRGFHFLKEQYAVKPKLPEDL